jgi:hypothetical protein
MARDGSKNLKRGVLGPDGKAPEMIPQPHGGMLMPGMARDGLAPKRALEESNRVHEAVVEDPDRALEEIHASLTAWTIRIVKRGARSSSPPDPATMNVIREFRQTQEAVNEARRAKGAIVEAKEFFGTLDERVAALARLSPEPLPVAEPP